MGKAAFVFRSNQAEDIGLAGRFGRVSRSAKTRTEPASCLRFKRRGDAASFDSIDLTRPLNSRFEPFGIWWRKCFRTFASILFFHLNGKMWNGSIKSASWFSNDGISI